MSPKKRGRGARSDGEGSPKNGGGVPRKIGRENREVFPEKQGEVFYKTGARCPKLLGGFLKNGEGSPEE
jgi:hypothetical protein